MEKSCESASCEWHFLCIILGGSTVGPVRFHEDIQNGRWWSDSSCVTLLILIAYAFWFGGSLTVESSSLQSLVYWKRIFSHIAENHGNESVRQFVGRFYQIEKGPSSKPWRTCVLYIVTVLCGFLSLLVVLMQMLWRENSFQLEMTKSSSMDFIAISDAASCANPGAQILSFSHSGSFGASFLIFMVNCAWTHSTLDYTLSWHQQPRNGAD
jgi:hypothetical protein